MFSSCMFFLCVTSRYTGVFITTEPNRSISDYELQTTSISGFSNDAIPTRLYLDRRLS